MLPRLKSPQRGDKEKYLWFYNICGLEYILWSQLQVWTVEGDGGFRWKSLDDNSTGLEYVAMFVSMWVIKETAPKQYQYNLLQRYNRTAILWIMKIITNVGVSMLAKTYRKNQAQSTSSFWDSTNSMGTKEDTLLLWGISNFIKAWNEVRIPFLVTHNRMKTITNQFSK